MSQKAEPQRPPPPAEESDHLVPLAEGWSSWRSFCLRGAGFPLALLEGLTAPRAVAAVDALLDNEARREDLRRRLLAVIEDVSGKSDRQRLQGLRRLRRQVLKDRRPEPPAEVPELAAPLAAFSEAVDAVQRAAAAAEAALAEDTSKVSGCLRDLAEDPVLREAVAWQNRKVLKDSIDVLRRLPLGKRNKPARRHEMLLASYLQRYCAKNETIGFFGPLAWGSWRDAGPALVQQPGAQLILSRSTHFEYWAITALAEVLAQDRELRPWLAPRFNGALRLDGGDLIDAEGKRHELKPEGRRLLAACDGATPARDIARRLLAEPDCDLNNEAEIYKVLANAHARLLVDWSLAVPVGSPPEAALRKVLLQVGDDALRARLLAPLEELVAARDAVAAAAGDAAALDRALGDLESLFTRITGRTPYHHHGRVYAGRSLVYEDCRRGASVDIGPELRAQIAPTLTLILQSARWYSHEIARRFDRLLRQQVEELGARHTPGPVPVVDLEFLFARDASLISGIVSEVARELTGKWQDILLPEPAGRRVALSSGELRD